VITAADGREALAKLSEHSEIDLLFSDVVMPGGISGWDVAQRAQQQRPGLKILLTSGYLLETMMPRVRPDLRFAILSKPYRKADLARRLREVLEGG
jgi:CheY-like chemotaxis protein